MSRDSRSDEAAGRWRRRALGATALRLSVLCSPVLGSFGAALVVHRLLPPVGSHLDRAWHLAVLLAVSTLVLLAVDRLGRRLLPLVTLLDLSMLFPDRAPSRVRVAREAIRRRPIEEQLDRVRKAGADPGAVAREILTLVAALSAHDKPTRGHAERVRMFTDLLAEQMGLPRRDRDLLRWAAILHDIGKLQVPTSLLNKPGKPTPEEWDVLKAHPTHGAETAIGLLPWLGEWAPVIVEHHERYDGTGYPSGLAGSQISLGARIVSVADAYDVMTAARAYKRPVSRAAALQELVKFSGTQFDPSVVRAMVAVGAPRLRRAQGVVAWVADIPLVAGAVPAATVARVVGAGALATGAVASGTAMSLPVATPSAAAQSVSSSAEAGGGGGGGGHDTGRGSGDSTAARGSSGLPGSNADRPAPAGAGTQDVPATGTAEPDGDTGTSAHPAKTPAPADPAPADPAPKDPAPKDPAPKDPAPKVTVPPVPVPTTPAPTGGGVGEAVGTVTGTVKKVVEDPVGTVTGTVKDPVGTVTGTVGTVTGAVGSLLGGGSGSSNSGPGSANSGPGSGSSPSPSPTKSGGLLGGLLGK